MREQLLGYLMGALDASQQREVELALKTDPQLRQELALLDDALAPLRVDRGLYEPPSGLADRTLDTVAAVAGWTDEVESGSEGRRPLAGDDLMSDELAISDELISSELTNEGRTSDAPGDGLVNEASLADDELAAEVEAARRAFDADEVGAPVETAFWASSRAPRRGRVDRAPAALSPARDGAPRSWTDRWAALDVAVSAAIVGAAAMLFFPAIFNSRMQAHITACQGHLQSIGRALEQYGENNQGQLVAIPPEGNLSIGGIYAPKLRDEGYILDDQTFFCASDLAQRRERADADAFRIPRVSELERATGAELRRLQQLAGGSFGYNLGYFLSNGRYSPVRDLRRPTFAVASDAPGPRGRGRLSDHHGGRGQNVLFADAHVEFTAGTMVGPMDDVFFSDRGLVEAGLNPDDAVIGDSHSSPMLFGIPSLNRAPHE